MTIPNEAISIQELLTRYTRRQPVNVTQREPSWTENPKIDDYDLEQVDRMDMAEKEQFAENLRDKISDLKTKTDEAAKAAEKEAADKKLAEEEALYDKFQKKSGKKSDPDKTE